MQVVPLHLHTEYSLLDGAIRIKQLCEFAKENGMDALAITDHGVMYGAIEFYLAAEAAGIKPIIGSEFYVYNGEISEKDPIKKTTYHLVLLAKNITGYKNLIKLTSIAQCEGFYYKPRINHKLLEQYSEGLICLSACIQGEVARYILDGDYQKAFDTAKYYKELFKDDYYIELQDHGLKEQKQSNPSLIKIAKELDIPLVITNDSHYLKQDDADWHDTLLCIQTSKLKNDPNRMRFPNNEFYVKTKDQLREAFRWMEAEEFDKCIENTNKIAEKCHVKMEFGKYNLPHFDLPEGYTAETYLVEKVKEGLQEKYEVITPEIEKRYKYELDVINKMGFPAYFLITQDFIKYAKTHDVPVGPGRGSAAGSIVAYALDITDIDPLEHNLLFERFLNPERVSMPDIDIDFCIKGRGRVIDYVTDKYGADKVCQIITFSELKAKAAFKAVARAYDLPFTESNAITAFIPKDLKMTLPKALEESPEFKQIYNEKENIRAIIDMAIKIEGIKQGTGMHAAGVIISYVPLNEIVPIQPAKEEGIVITQYPMAYLDQIGLLKMDFLGLQNLTIMAAAIKLIKQRHNIDLNINRIPLDDKMTFELLQKAKTNGVFQLESSGMKNLIMKLKPTVFGDLSVLVALYRPGPLESGMIDDYIARKHGTQEVTYAHPLLEPILKETNGTLVYQEQIMQIFQYLAGYSLGGADKVRRMMGKKKLEEMAKQKTIFVAGAAKNGMAEKDSIALFEQIESFAKYCFNKAHSAAYAFVAFQTAYLKAHYPVEYMAALLSAVSKDQAKTQNYIAECQEMGIKILPPDINKSDLEFTPDEKNIRFGLISIKGLGEVAINAVLEERKNGIFTDIADFATRLDTKSVNKKTLECLAKSGAFNSFGVSRKQILNNIDNIINLCQEENASKLSGQGNLFASFGESFYKNSFKLEGDNVEFADSEIQNFEKDFLGFYVTSHPLSSIKNKLPFLTTHTISSLLENHPKNTVTICGLISNVAQRPYKSNPEKFLKTGLIEDLTGKIDFKMFYNDLVKNGGKQEFDEKGEKIKLSDSQKFGLANQTSALLQTSKKVILTGQLDQQAEDRYDFTISKVVPVENSNVVTVSLKENFTFEQIVQFKDELTHYKGPDPIIIKMKNKDKDVKLLCPNQFWVRADNDFIHNFQDKYKDKIEIKIDEMDN